MATAAPEDLTRWIARLFREPALLRMGHNQRADDLNLGLGWLYYALGRLVHPRRVVVIGSYRGFVPLLLARACQENVEDGEVVFIDPSLVDDFWKDTDRVREWFGGFGLTNVRHFAMTTQEFVETDAYRALGEIGILFVDGYHTAEQARFDWRSFEGLLAPHGFALFHDSMIRRPSKIYGAEHAYDISVRDLIEELARDPALQTFDVPFGTGVTLVRKLGPESAEPFLEGRQALP
jgi:predicted O-methyltransferase YrrM